MREIIGWEWKGFEDGGIRTSGALPIAAAEPWGTTQWTWDEAQPYSQGDVAGFYQSAAWHRDQDFVTLYVNDWKWHDTADGFSGMLARTRECKVDVVEFMSWIGFRPIYSE